MATPFCTSTVSESSCSLPQRRIQRRGMSFVVPLQTAFEVSTTKAAVRATWLRSKMLFKTAVTKISCFVFIGDLCVIFVFSHSVKDVRLLSCTALYCISPYCTVLYCTVLRCIPLYCIVSYSTVLCCMLYANCQYTQQIHMYS